MLATDVAIAGLAAAGAGLFLRGASETYKRRAVDRRLSHFVLSDGIAVQDAPSVATARRGPDLSAFKAALTRRLTRTSFGAVVQTRLARAGVDLKVSEYILLHAAAVIGAAFLFWLLNARLPGAARLSLAMVGAGIGYVIPSLVLRIKEQRRMAAFERQLPQAIDLMAGSLRAGSTLGQAIDAIAREMDAPISEEFRRVKRDVELGQPLTASLEAMAKRVRTSDLELLSSAVAVQHRTGGDLSPMLLGLSKTIRERQRIRGEVSTLTAQARVSAYIVGALPIFLFGFLWLTNYAYLSNLFLPGMQRILLVLAVVGEVAGFFLMRRMATVEV
jgi:tight adherence protein B